MNKEHAKKLLLGSFGLIALLYIYFAFFLGPLNKSRNAVQTKIQDLQQKIASSKTDMSKAAKREENAHSAKLRYDALLALSPEGAPIAWFPPRIKTFFSSQQIDKASARLESSNFFKEKELASWVRYIWVIDLPQADFESLGNALALLENSNPLLAINKLRIHASSNDPAMPQVALTAATVIDKK